MGTRIGPEPPGGTLIPTRRLIVVSYHFPPNGEVGGLRWSGLTKYLARLGWECWVVTAAAPSHSSEPGVRVVSVPRAKILNERLLEWKERRRGGQPMPTSVTDAGPPSPAKRGRLMKALFRLRHEIGFLLLVPDEGRGWTLRAARRTRRLIKDIRPHVVVSSGPPHSAHAAALLATRGTRVRWVMDLRDPWAWPIAKAFQGFPRYRSSVFMGVNRMLERAALSAAGLIICNTSELTDALGRRHPAKRFEWVPNSVDPETLPKQDRPGFPGLSIAYVGTVYGGRDVTPVLRGLRRFLDLHPGAAAAGTKLRIAGNMHEERGREFRACVTALGLEDHVEVLGLLPREEALSVAARSRITVVLAQDQDWQVPAKLYEMVGLGRQTLVVANEPSAAASEGRRLGAVVVVPEDADGLLSALVGVWRQAGEGLWATPLVPSGYQELAPRIAEMLLHQ